MAEEIAESFMMEIDEEEEEDREESDSTMIGLFLLIDSEVERRWWVNPLFQKGVGPMRKVIFTVW